MPRTLLLADDSVVIQKLVGLSFANENLKIITVDNGDDAVAQINEVKPDIVLADVVMPGKSGYEVCEAVKRSPELANTPVLLLTGTFEAFDEGRAQEAGADGHITKPFEGQTLVDRVNELLEASNAVQPTPGVATSNPGATGGNDFFDDNLGNLGGPTDSLALQAEALASEGSDDDFAFGTSESAPLYDIGGSSDLSAQGETVGMKDVPDAGASDRTVALDSGPDDFAATPAPPPLPVNDFGSPEATVLADDLLATPPPMPAPAAPAAPDPEATVLTDDIFGEQPFATPAAADPLASSLGTPPPLAMDDLSMEGLSMDGLAGDDLSFDSHPGSTPPPAGPAGDETVLADDLFGEPSDTPAAPETVVAPPPLPPSNGLDIDFQEPLGDSGIDAQSPGEAIVPESAGDFDVSSSDLKVNPYSQNPSWDSSADLDASLDPNSSAGQSDPFLGGPDPALESQDPILQTTWPNADRADPLLDITAPGEERGQSPQDSFASAPPAAPFEAPPLLEADPIAQAPLAVEPPPLEPPPARTFEAEPAWQAPAMLQNVPETPAPALAEPIAQAFESEPPALTPPPLATSPMEPIGEAEAMYESEIASPPFAVADEEPLGFGEVGRYEEETTSPELVAAEPLTTSAQQAEATPHATADLSPMMRDRIHDTLEKVAWEAFSDVSDTLVRQVLERVEKIAWEVIPQMAETLVREEIRRMKDEQD